MNEYQQTADLLEALSTSKRIQILDLLSAREMTVTELVGKMGLRKANVSQHLAILRYMDLVKFRRDGKRVFYRLPDPKTIRLVKSIQQL